MIDPRGQQSARIAINYSLFLRWWEHNRDGWLVGSNGINVTRLKLKFKLKLKLSLKKNIIFPRNFERENELLRGKRRRDRRDNMSSC